MSEATPWWYQQPTKKKRLTNRIIAAIIVCILVTTITVIAVNNYFKTISQGGIIKDEGLGVYWDEACLISCDHIDWGDMSRGETKTNTTWVLNEGDHTIQLNYSHHDFSALNLQYNISLTLTFNAIQLNPDEKTSALWSLTIFDNCTFGSIAWSTTINGTIIP